MLIPQYSIRWLLVLTAVCAVVFSIFALAVQGSHWAQCVSIGIVALVLMLVIHACFFTLLWVFSLLIAPFVRHPIGAGRSPFAGGPAAPAANNPATAAGDKEIPATPILLD